MSIVDKLTKRGLASPPTHLKNNIHYEVMMGSIAYGCNTDTSDVDIYGFSIPPKEIIFPHLNGYIPGFGSQPNKFEQYQQHHIKDTDKKTEYDITIFSIVKYFHLVMNNNPNMLDSLFVPRRCVLHSTQVGEHIRENRHLFLSKKAWHTYKGYAYAQLNKCKNKNINAYIDVCESLGIKENISMENFLEIEDRYADYDVAVFKKIHTKVHQSGKLTSRVDMIKKHGYDVKFAYHIVRLLNEVEQILTEHDLDLERNREQLKSIRRGDWTLTAVEEYFEQKEKELEKINSESTLRWSANEDEIKTVLMECLEMHYGSLEKAVIIPDINKSRLQEASIIIERVIQNMRLGN